MKGPWVLLLIDSWIIYLYPFRNARSNTWFPKPGIWALTGLCKIDRHQNAAKYNARQGPLLLTWFNFNPNMPSKVWDEITNPFLNFNGCTVEV